MSLNPRERPFFAAVSAWFICALCIYAWELLWVVVGLTGLVDEYSVAGPARKWGTVPAMYASLPWSNLLGFPPAESIGGQLAFILALGTNAIILGCLFGPAIQASRYGVLALRWSVKAFAGITIVPIFFILIFLNIDIMATLLPKILPLVDSRRGGILGFLVSCPIPLLVCFFYYKLFYILDRGLIEGSVK